jgi:ubiquinone/menaquinone biosynthesis C-methylase UbiE
MRDKTVPTSKDARREVRRAQRERKARFGAVLRDAFVELSGIGPDAAVLDVGCGPGRMARPFAEYLDASGTYTGLDVRAELIHELEATLGAEHPNLRFVAADVQNAMYKPDGSASAADYVLPFADESFDLVFLYSVFTHMFPGEVENYLSQVARVLKPGGCAAVTYHLLNEQSLAAIETRPVEHRFVHHFDVYAVDSLEDPADAVGYDEDWVRDLYARLGLELQEPVRHGAWCRDEGFYRPEIPQDIVVALKR